MEIPAAVSEALERVDEQLDYINGDTVVDPNVHYLQRAVAELRSAVGELAFACDSKEA